MNITTYTNARQNLKALMDNVCADHVPTVITSVNNNHVVVLSLKDYESMQESLHIKKTATQITLL